MYPAFWAVLLGWSLYTAVAEVAWPWVAWVNGVCATANIFLWREARLRTAHGATREDLRKALDKIAHTGLPGYDEAGNRVPDVTSMKNVDWCGKPGLHEPHPWNFNLQSAVGQFGETLLVNYYTRCPGHPDQFNGIGEVEAFLQEG